MNNQKKDDPKILELREVSVQANNELCQNLERDNL